ncbi:type A2 lanthipeptide [Streptococcus salivarius]
MKKEYELMNTIQEISLDELYQIIGAGNGVFKTISHEFVLILL